MDEIHRQRITSTLKTLIEKTRYEALVHSFEKMDRKGVIPNVLLAKWKERPNLGWNTKQVNCTLYEEIQCRGPDAFQLLIDSLQNSGHQDLACVLDPSLKKPEESDETEAASNVQQYYSEDGPHFVYIDSFWEGQQCNKDRDVMKNLFLHHGYEETKEVPTEDIGSLVVINFSSFQNGGIQREKVWTLNHFNKTEFEEKPKILISFRYTYSMELVQHDTARKRQPFRDVLRVNIYLKGEKTGANVSPEVETFKEVFSRRDPSTIEEKFLKLTSEFKKKNFEPIEIKRENFKRFRFSKLRS